MRTVANIIFGLAMGSIIPTVIGLAVKYMTDGSLLVTISAAFVGCVVGTLSAAWIVYGGEWYE